MNLRGGKMFCRNSRPAPNHRRRFTLIELLVVIAIIAILAAMLLPVLSRAKEKAHTALCLCNEKQQWLAVQMNADEHDDSYVPGGGMLSTVVSLHDLSEFDGGNDWVIDSFPYGSYWDPSPNRTPSNIGARYTWFLMRGGHLVAEQEVFRCPSDARSDMWSPERCYNVERFPWSRGSYTLNGHFMHRDHKSSLFRGDRVAASYLLGIGPPDEVPGIVEYRSCGGWIFGFCHGWWGEGHGRATPDWHPNGFPTDDPGLGMNIVFLDGHGEFVRDIDELVLEKVNRYIEAGSDTCTRMFNAGGHAYIDKHGVAHTVNQANGYLGGEAY